MFFDVYGKKIKVEHVKNLNSDGTFSHEKNLIQVRHDIKDVELIEVYLHELFHAMCDRMGLENTNLDHNIEELLGDNFSRIITENFELKVKAKCKRRK